MTQAKAVERILQWDEIVIGEEAKPVTIEVTPQAMANYCTSVGEDNTVFTDDRMARAQGYPGIVAPASMYFYYAPARRLDIMHEDGFISPEEASVNPRATPFVGTEARWHGVYICPGDRITSVCRFANKWQAGSGNRFLSIGVEATNQRGEKVVSYLYNVMWEFARGQKSRAAGGVAGLASAAPAQSSGKILTPTNLAYDAIQPGDTLPSIQRRITQQVINDYTSLNDREGRGPGPTSLLHVDEAFAQATVFAGTTLQGPAAVGHLVVVLTKGFGLKRVAGGATLTERALEPVRPGDTISYSGRVLDKRVEQGARLVEVELKGTNQLGQTTAVAKVTVSV